MGAGSVVLVVVVADAVVLVVGVADLVVLAVVVADLAVALGGRGVFAATLGCVPPPQPTSASATAHAAPTRALASYVLMVSG